MLEVIEVRKDWRVREEEGSTQSDQPVEAPSRPELWRASERVIRLLR